MLHRCVDEGGCRAILVSSISVCDEISTIGGSLEGMKISGALRFYISAN